MSQPFNNPRSFQDPSLDWAVTPDQRNRAESYLQAAYAEGRVSGDEFEDRISKVLTAHSRRDLNEAFAGLVRIGPGPNLYTPTTYSGGASLVRSGSEPTVGGAIAQFSALATWVVGPGLIAAATKKGSPAYREAAKAFNATISATVVWVVLGIVHQIIPWFDWLNGLAAVLWVVFMIVGGIKAAHGEDWTNPFTKWIPIHLLDDGHGTKR